MMETSQEFKGLVAQLGTAVFVDLEDLVTQVSDVREALLDLAVVGIEKRAENAHRHQGTTVSITAALPSGRRKHTFTAPVSSSRYT